MIKLKHIPKQEYQEMYRNNKTRRCEWCNMIIQDKSMKDNFCCVEHKRQAETFRKHEKDDSGFAFNPAMTNYGYEHAFPKFAI